MGATEEGNCIGGTIASDRPTGSAADTVAACVTYLVPILINGGAVNRGAGYGAGSRDITPQLIAPAVKVPTVTRLVALVRLLALVIAP